MEKLMSKMWKMKRKLKENIYILYIYIINNNEYI